MKTKKTGSTSRAKSPSKGLISGKDHVDFRFGEVVIRAEEADVNAWRCIYGEEVIGVVKFAPTLESGYEYGRRTHGFSGYSSVNFDDAENHPATEINCYSSLRNAVQAVTARHFSGKLFTYIAQNIAVMSGKVVLESVFKGRKVIKPSLS